VFGRGGRLHDDSRPRLELCRERPNETTTTAPIESRFLSRVQLELTHDGDALCVANVGRCPLLVGGRSVASIALRSGGWFALKDQLAFVCVERSSGMPELRHVARPLPAFGEADEHNLVGESPAAWALRDRLAFVAAHEAPVLLVGESGTGKELVARAIHALSR